MSEIVKKIESLKRAGFEPIAVLMTQVLLDDLIIAAPYLTRSQGLLWQSIPESIVGIPIKIKESSDTLYSIEVA